MGIKEITADLRSIFPGVPDSVEADLSEEETLFGGGLDKLSRDRELALKAFALSPLNESLLNALNKIESQIASHVIFDVLKEDLGLNADALGANDLVELDVPALIESEEVLVRVFTKLADIGMNADQSCMALQGCGALSSDHRVFDTLSDIL